jgi:hypothetical protein
MPLVYDVNAESKVTVRKILTMRNRWYTAARTVVQQYLNSKVDRQGANVRANLMKLNRAYAAHAVEMPDPYPDTNTPADGYVAAEDYGRYFDMKLPMDLASEINTACGGSAQDLTTIKKSMAIAFIRAANADEQSWTTIRALMYDTNRNEYYLSTLTPINEEFDETYDHYQGIEGKRYGKTGLTSMNERIPPRVRTEQEAWRPANFWYSELHVSDAKEARKEELFAGFRSGAFCAYAESDKKKRKWANLARAMGVVEAMAIQKLKNLQRSQFAGLDDYFTGTHTLPIVVASIDLLSDAPTLLKGDAVMVRDHHAALHSLDGRELTFIIRWTTKPGIAVKKKVTVFVTVLDFNLAVNQAATFVLSSAQDAANKISLARLKNQMKNKLERDRKRAAQLKARRETLQDRIRGLQDHGGDPIQKALYQSQIEELNENQVELRRLERTDLQIEALWQGIKGSAMGEYNTPALIINLAYLLGLSVHFNCKSGKDRTGLADIESKFLARELYIKREEKSPNFDDGLPDLEFNAGEKYRHQQLLWESGSLQILERNTRGQSLKVAEMSFVPGTYDAALRDRLGGDAVLKDLKGLADYTLLVDKMLEGAAPADDKAAKQVAKEPEDLGSVAILLKEKAGQWYMFNDGILPVSQGQIDDDGMLIQPVSIRSKQAVIAFPDGSEPITLEIDHTPVDGEDDEEDDQTE